MVFTLCSNPVCVKQSVYTQQNPGSPAPLPGNPGQFFINVRIEYLVRDDMTLSHFFT